MPRLHALVIFRYSLASFPNPLPAALKIGAPWLYDTILTLAKTSAQIDVAMGRITM